MSHGHARSYVVFDVGDTTVGVGLAVCGVAGCSILWQQRVRYVYEVADEYARYERAMLAALLDISMNLVAEGVRIAGTNPAFDVKHAIVVCVVAPPWFRSIVQVGTKRSDQVVAVTHSLLDEVRAALYTGLLDDVDTKKWCHVMGAPEPLEQVDLRTRLDGYEVPIRGERAHEVELTSYSAVISQRVAHNIRDILERTLPNHEHHIITSTRLLLQRAQTRCEHVRAGGCVIELGGRVSNLALIREGCLVATVPFPHGSDHVLQALAPRAASALEAQGVYELQTHDVRDPIDFSALPEALRIPLLAWHSEVVRASGDAADGITLPRQALLIAGSLWRPVMSAVLTQPFLQVGVRKQAGFTVCTCLTAPATTGVGSAHDERLELLLAAVDGAASAPGGAGAIL